MSTTPPRRRRGAGPALALALLASTAAGAPEPPLAIEWNTVDMRLGACRAPRSGPVPGWTQCAIRGRRPDGENHDGVGLLASARTRSGRPADTLIGCTRSQGDRMEQRSATLTIALAGTGTDLAHGAPGQLTIARAGKPQFGIAIAAAWHHHARAWVHHAPDAGAIAERIAKASGDRPGTVLEWRALDAKGRAHVQVRTGAGPALAEALRGLECAAPAPAHAQGTRSAPAGQGAGAPPGAPAPAR